MRYTVWKIPYRAPAALSPAEAGCSPLLAAVLARRGMTDPAGIRRFLGGGEETLGDPLLLADMDKAVERLRRALDTGERIAVYGDYDVDGITSTVLLSDHLRSLGADCLTYIPDRLDEGYGVSDAAVDTLHAKGVTLIVTVDCGVTAALQAEHAAALGIDMIITDHHECPETLPRAVAVVNPKRPDSAYPFRALAGVGVAFQLLCALTGDGETVLARYADLVAVGTVADVMPLIDENRLIVRRGLEKLESDPRPGLKALTDESGLCGRRLTATNVGYTLAPRINAAGRLGRAELAMSLLTVPAERCAPLAEELCRLNRERQALETEIWRQARQMLGDGRPQAPIVLAGEGWHQGVIGIVASRLAEAYRLPAVMICLDGDSGKGSCRSWGGFNLFEALSACAEHLLGFGGHALAAGLTLRRENVDAFRSGLAQYFAAHPCSQESVLDIDLAIDTPSLLDMEQVADLARLEPCGAANPAAQLCLCGATLEAVTPIGGGRHLRLRLSKYGQSWDAVFFSKTVEELGAREGDYVDAAFQAQINEFYSRRSVQLLITDLRRHDLSAPKAVLGGALPELAGGEVPDRADFAAVWRGLSARGGAVRGSLRTVFESTCPGMWDVRLCLCLKVFEELGLLTAAFDGQTLDVRQVPGAGRVDLADSRILRSLAGKK